MTTGPHRGREALLRFTRVDDDGTGKGAVVDVIGV
jgi:hypothetical protein